MFDIVDNSDSCISYQIKDEIAVLPIFAFKIYSLGRKVEFKQLNQSHQLDITNKQCKT